MPQKLYQTIPNYTKLYQVSHKPYPKTVPRKPYPEKPYPKTVPRKPYPEKPYPKTVPQNRTPYPYPNKDVYRCIFLIGTLKKIHRYTSLFGYGYGVRFWGTVLGYGFSGYGFRGTVLGYGFSGYGFRGTVLGYGL